MKFVYRMSPRDSDILNASGARIPGVMRCEWRVVARGQSVLSYETRGEDGCHESYGASAEITVNTPDGRVLIRSDGTGEGTVVRREDDSVVRGLAGLSMKAAPRGSGARPELVLRFIGDLAAPQNGAAE